MTYSSSFLLPTEADTLAAGESIASGFKPGIIFLRGDLGAGKTTFCRGLLQGLNYIGSVKSPTFTIVEPYEINNLRIAHFDLYRMEDPEELDFLGFRDYLSNDTLCLIEWPEKGRGYLPEPDLDICISHQGRMRQISWQNLSKTGESLAKGLSSFL